MHACSGLKLDCAQWSGQFTLSSVLLTVRAIMDPEAIYLMHYGYGPLHNYQQGYIQRYYPTGFPASQTSRDPDPSQGRLSVNEFAGCLVACS